jgi:cytochrome P450
MNDLAKVWSVPPATCPVGSIGHRYNPFDHDLMYDTLAEARMSEPVFYSPDLDYWVVTRYNDVITILRDPDRFSAANANTPITPVPAEALELLKTGGYALEGIQVNADPPKHTRIRVVASQAMGMKRFIGMESEIRDLVRVAINRMRGKSRVDLMMELTYELPAKVIFILLGIPEGDAPKVKSWATQRLMLSFSRPTKEQQIEAARNLLNFWHYCVELVRERIENPGDDFSSDLLRLRNGDDSIITLNEINSASFGLLFAGHETTTSQITNTINAMLEQKVSWRAICENPALIPNAVEEGLRLNGAVANWRRRANSEVEIAGRTIPAGSNILISFASANRDAEIFPDPDLFSVRRPNSRKHLSFGHGIHTCLGAALARLEMRVMLEELTKAFPNMELAGSKVSFAPAFAFRAPQALWVDLDGSRSGDQRS